ncbi:MAG: hypothetical protein U0Q19_04355 [Kineosporiaceae bacterium]
MTTDNQRSRADRAARNAILIEGLPVFLLGSVALTLGSNPDQTGAAEWTWLGLTLAFVLALVWVTVRNVRRKDEYLRKLQLESMAIAFAGVLVALQIATLLDATGRVALRLTIEPIIMGGIALWLLIADLRTRLHR